MKNYYQSLLEPIKAILIKNYKVESAEIKDGELGCIVRKHEKNNAYWIKAYDDGLELHSFIGKQYELVHIGRTVEDITDFIFI